MRMVIEDMHLRPSQRLLVGVAWLSTLAMALLWFLAWDRARWLVIGAAPVLCGVPFGWALGYISGSWVRISAHRGISWCLATRGLGRSKQLGSVELHAADIAELRLESTLLGRMLGLWDLQIIRRDGQPVPRFRFFQRMDQVAETLHAYLHQKP